MPAGSRSPCCSCTATAPLPLTAPTRDRAAGQPIVFTRVEVFGSPGSTDPHRGRRIRSSRSPGSIAPSPGRAHERAAGR
jgi:hypothetical protein